MRNAGDDNNGGTVVNMLVANVGGMIVECSGDGVGRGVCGGKGGRNRAGLEEARGWSAAGTNSRLATLMMMMCFGVIVVICTCNEQYTMEEVTLGSSDESLTYV